MNTQMLSISSRLKEKDISTCSSFLNYTYPHIDDINEADGSAVFGCKLFVQAAMGA